MKVMNPEWRKIDIEPMDLRLRDEIGVSLDVEQLSNIKTVVNDLLGSSDNYREAIQNIIDERLYNINQTAKVGGDYLIGQILTRRSNREQD